MRKSTPFAAGLAALVLTGGALVSAGQALAATPDTPEARLATAKQLVVAVNAAANMRNLTDLMVGSMTSSLGRMTGDSSMAKYMADLIHEEMDRIVPAYISRVAQIYADTFDEPELEGLLAFYRTPLGQRLIEKQPELARRSAEAAQPLVLPMQMDMISKAMDHVCEVKHCSADELKQMEAAKAQILQRLKAQAAAADRDKT